MTSPVSVPDRQTGDLLLVDDNPANLNVLRDTLLQRGHRVRCALSGEMALTGIESRPPDLIMLDIMMPVQNGYEVCRELKANPKTADIPVIFISAMDEVFDKVKAFEAGGVDYITKPFHAEEVYARIDTHLRLRRIQIELERFNRLLAHDLKNPLQVIHGSAELLEMEIGENEDLIAIRQGVRRAIDITESMLLLAQIDHQVVKLEPLKMTDLIADVMRDLSPLSQSFSATYDVPSSWPDVVGHPTWVRQMWTNYISNAIKYGGRPPSVRLSVELASSTHVKFCITDNGSGLSLDEQDRLFTEFTRLGHNSNIQGHGLGLVIVRRMAERLGGEAGVSSEIGQGSTFYFTLPLA